jgi:protein gp37
MSAKTSIQWTDATWNPTRGCSRVSEGCRNCYAESIAARFSDRGPDGAAHDKRLPFEGFAVMTPSGPRWTGRVELIEDKLGEPLRWRKPRRIFVNSMSDLFHEALPDEAIDRVFSVMALRPQHQFQILTKRPGRMLEWGATVTPDRIDSIIEQLSRPEFEWPLPNVWLGVSVEDQATADERIPLLLQTPAAVRFVSYEPALTEIDIERWLYKTCRKYDPEIQICDGPNCPGRGVDWVIVGGESGPGARPLEIEWVRSTVRQCRAANVACFVKQLGAVPLIPEVPVPLNVTGPDAIKMQSAIDREWPAGTHFGNRTGNPKLNGRQVLLKDSKGGNWLEWPLDLRVREFPEARP